MHGLWSSIADAVLGPDNRLYVTGRTAGTQRIAIWCLGPDLAARWTTPLADVAEPRLALDPGGSRLCVATSGRRTLAMLSTANGALLESLAVDAGEASWLRADIDGTLLALIGERLVRFASNGAVLPTWPGVVATSDATTAPTVETVGHLPTALSRHARLLVSWSGRLHAQMGRHAACFDRRGAGVYRIQLPLDAIDLACDGAGNLHVLGDFERGRAIIRVAPDGGNVQAITGGAALGNDRVLRVARDGTMFLLGANGSVRVLERSGRVACQNEASQVAVA
jgi:hypothetical protein